MGRIYDRTIRVTVIKRPTGFIGSNPQFFETIGNATEIEGMRIRFEVSKHLAKDPNKCTIKIHNLAANTRSELDVGSTAIRLHAGHDGNLRLLFVGDLRRSSTAREGTDIVTTLQVADGAAAYAHAHMSRSYKPPTTLLRVLQDAAKSMDLELPRDVLDRPELKQSVSGGVTAHGSTRDVLTSLLNPYGYGWSIQNGQLQMLRDGDLRAGELFVVDADSGLVDKPERTVPEKEGGKSEVKFNVLLYPELVPGSKVKLVSEFINLDVKLTDVTHTGDNDASDKMVTSVSGKPLSQEGSA